MVRGQPTRPNQAPPAMAAVHDVSNPEVAAAMGADLVVLNLLDVRRPAVHAIEVADAARLAHVLGLAGRIAGVRSVRRK